MADESIHMNEGPPDGDAASGVRAGTSKMVSILGVALVVLIAGIAIGIRMSGSSTAGAQSAVRGALVSTIAKGTATLAIAESIDVEGQIGTAKGSGKCDLRADACSATLNYTGALAQLGSETMVYSHRILYLKLAGTVGASFPTPWISLPLMASNRPSALGSTGSPLAGLALLTRDGSVLKDEGTVLVDGVSMHQYGVTMSKLGSTRVVDRDVAGLPTWLRNPTSQGPLGALSMTLDVNARGTIGRVRFVTSAVQDRTYAIVHATETFVNYGGPVSIVVPSKREFTFVNALAGTLTRYCAPPPSLRLGPSSKPIVNHT